MKKMIILSAIILVVILSGCMNSIAVTMNSPSIEAPRETPESTPSEVDQAMRYYKDVMQNRIQFTYVSYFDGSVEYQSIYLNELINIIIIDNPSYFYLGKFAIEDLDGDTVPEIVIEVDSEGGYIDFIQVLHYSRENVYGYYFDKRCMQDLKKDGTYFSSSSAYDTSIEKVAAFIDNDICIDILAYSETTSETDQDGYPIIKYYIADKPVTEADFNLFFGQLNKKEDVIWFSFDENNITTQFERVD